MAIVISPLIPTAERARSLAAITNGGDQPTWNVIDVAINSAINSGLFSTTASLSGISAQDRQTAMNMLQALGYTVSLTASTLTISW